MATSHRYAASQLFSVRGWVVLVSGGETFAANGAKVYITGRRGDVLEKSAQVHGAPEKLGESGGSIIPLVMDITSKDSIKNAVAQITEKEGFINVLVNAVGIFKYIMPTPGEAGAEAVSAALFSESIEDTWEDQYRTNTIGTFLVTAAFLPLLKKAESSPTGVPGNVVNILSKDALYSSSTMGRFAYSASKAAGLHLTKMLAFEFAKGEIGVRVNAIAPGPTPTGMTGPLDDENYGNDSSEALDMVNKATAGTWPRWTKPQEIATPILALATNNAIYGSIVPIDLGELLRHP
ncbi:hypothetical protein BX600DRAFT_518981 [Xylariales sp. PMI_506]|nr:hypothetical protein BX600DRAFT_518981 [Xylariales sp. PMI_506]